MDFFPEKTCTSLPVLENGRFEGFFSKVGASKIAKCDNGYELVGATSVICSEDGWKFNGKEPKCLGELNQNYLMHMLVINTLGCQVSEYSESVENPNPEFSCIPVTDRLHDL